MDLNEKLSEIVEHSESFQKIMADGVVEDAEVEGQANRVSELFAEVEKALSPTQFELVSKCIAELCVLNAVYRYNQIHM